MAQRQLVERVIDDLADGTPVDWDLLEREVPEDERELLKYVRILSNIANLHRSTANTPERTAPARREEPLELEGSTDDLGPWGRYRLTASVGEGSFGRVYRAWDSELEREVAIKVLHDRVADTNVRDRLVAEGRALARVRHANVVTVYGLEAHGDRVGLCMEFVRGETLDSVMRASGKMSAREAALIGEDVCRALAAVHAAGFVHRDVKLRNVMRDHSGRVVLMDFGTGRETRQVQQGDVVSVAGTPMYMAPEVLAGLAASETSDVYSVGVVLYHLVTGAFPVEGRSFEELRAAHMQGLRRPLSDRRSDLPIGFIQVVDRALAPDPRQRYQSAGALLEALARLGAVAEPSVLKRVFRGLLAIASGASLLTVLGMLSSRQLNARLERSSFQNEGVQEWFVVGAQSLLAPFVLLLLIVASLALAAVLRNVLLATSEQARRFDEELRARLASRLRRLRLNDVSVLASGLVLLSAGALLAAWFAFAPFVDALARNVSNAPPDTLALIAPDPRCTVKFCPAAAYPLSYRTTMMWILDLSVLGWLLVRRVAAVTQQRLKWTVAAGGAVVTLLGAVLLTYPFRMIYDAAFDVVTWNGAQCYRLGERADTRLVFCPDLAPPRTRTVGPDATLTRANRSENLLTRFARPTGSIRQ